MNQSEYGPNREFSDMFISQIKDILKTCLGDIKTIRVASDTEDQKQATDLVIQLTKKRGTVACRMRRDKIYFRDLTIRSRSCCGQKTELDKLREGFADWYLYGWTKNGKIAEWILVDLRKVRTKGLLNQPRFEQSNTDGKTKFISISIRELFESCCLKDWLGNF